MSQLFLLVFFVMVVKLLVAAIPTKRRRSINTSNRPQPIKPETVLAVVVCGGALYLVVLLVVGIVSYAQRPGGLAVILLFLAAAGFAVAAIQATRAELRKRGHDTKTFKCASTPCEEAVTPKAELRKRSHDTTVFKSAATPLKEAVTPKDDDYDERKVYAGRDGEIAVSIELSFLKFRDDKHKSIVLNNLILMGNDGVTTQIDHVVISCYGIFVIETKCFTGWIFGSEQSREWTQSIYNGREVEKRRFQNPIRQNWRHIFVLSEKLGVPKELFHNVVVFAGDAEFKTQMPKNVVKCSEIESFILSHDTPLIKESQVEEIANAINEWAADVSPESRASHVENVRRRHSAVSKDAPAPNCPLCRSQMVVRTNRYTGERFYGCVHYPKCRGIVKIRRS